MKNITYYLMINGKLNYWRGLLLLVTLAAVVVLDCLVIVKGCNP